MMLEMLYSATKRLFIVMAVIFFLFICGYYNISAGVMVGEDYFYEDNKQFSEYDPEYGTTTSVRFKYENRHIYVQMQVCTWRFKGWDHIWLDDSQGRRIGYWDVQRSREGQAYVTNGHQAYRKEMPWVDIGGIKPDSPQGNIIKVNDRYYYDFSATPNTTAAFRFDYFHTTDNNNVSFESSDGTAAGVTDYITSFNYVIDENPDTIVTENNSQKNTDGHLDITDYVNSDRSYYIHIITQSYTGRYSDQADKKIGKYHIEYRYNRSDSDNEFIRQNCLCDAGYKIIDAEEIKEPYGYVFGGWNTKKDGSGLWHYPCEDVINLAGPDTTITLYAQWKRTQQFVVYNGNGGSPDNDKIYNYDASGQGYYEGGLFIKKGYLFKEWNTLQNGMGDTYQIGDNLRLKDGLTYITCSSDKRYCVDADNDKKEDFTNVTSWFCHGGKNQKFAFDYVKTENGVKYWKIWCANGSARVLDVLGNTAVNGQNVILYRYNGSDGQLWTIESADNGYYYIRSKLGNYYLSLDSSRPGENVQIWEKTDNDAQKWELTDASDVLYAQWKRCGFELIKSAATSYKSSIVKRTLSDDSWYNTVGHLKIEESRNYPDNKCMQIWKVDRDGNISRLK